MPDTFRNNCVPFSSLWIKFLERQNKLNLKVESREQNCKLHVWLNRGIIRTHFHLCDMKYGQKALLATASFVVSLYFRCSIVHSSCHVPSSPFLASYCCVRDLQSYTIYSSIHWSRCGTEWLFLKKPMSKSFLLVLARRWQIGNGVNIAAAHNHALMLLMPTGN